MAYEGIGVDWTFPAAADLSTKQYRIGKINTTGQVDVASAAAAPADQIGIIQDKVAAVGRAVQVRLTGISKVVAGGAINPGALVMSDGNGAAVTATTTKYAIGQYIGTAACASGDIITVWMPGLAYQV